MLLVLFGLWRGMFKMIYGLISTLLALVLAVVLTTSVATAIIDNTQADEMIVTAIGQPLNALIPKGQQVVSFYDLDMDEETPDELGYNFDGQNYPFEDIMKDSKLAFLTGTVKGIVEKQVEKEGEMAVIDAVTAVVTSYIIAAATYIALWIALYIVIRLLCVLLKKAVSHTYIGYYLNKVLGAVLGAAFGLFLVFAFLTLVRLLGNYEVIIPVNTVIESSSMVKLLAENNFLYTFIADKIDLQSMIDLIMARISAISG